jgi:hypothetical protein
LKIVEGPVGAIKLPFKKINYTIKAVPGITDVTTDQLNAGPLLDITIKRDVASSYGILPYTIDNTLDDAFGQRIVSTMHTTLQQYHVILEVNPEFQYGPAAGGAFDAGRFGGEGRPLVINHQGQFPSVTSRESRFFCFMGKDATHHHRP